MSNNGTLIEGPIAARRIKKCLIRRFGFKDSNVTLLLDDTDPKVGTADNVLLELKKMISNSKPGDSLLMFCIGHGGGEEPLTDDISRYYMACSNNTYIDGSQLLPIMNSVQHDRSLTVIMDVCNSGGIFRGLAQEHFKPFTENVILNGSPSSNAIMITSCRWDQTAETGFIGTRSKAYNFRYPKSVRKFYMKKAGEPRWIPSTAFVEVFRKAAKKFAGDSTKNFVKCTVKKMKRGYSNQIPQLFCNTVQADSKFLC